MTKKLLLLGSAALLTVVLAGCDTDDPDKPAPSPAATTVAASPGPSAVQRDEDDDDNQFPPQPSPDTVRAYVQDLREIDPDIVEGAGAGADAIVTRGRAQCVQLYDSDQKSATLRNSANVHFATEKHPEGFGDATADKINATVKKYLCRTTWK